MPERPSGPSASPGSRTVLIVEDTSVVRRVAHRILTDLEHRVIEAGGAEEAMTRLREREGRVDLLLVDVMMPGTNGVEFVRQVHEHWPDVPVLFMSGYPAQILVQQGLDDPRVLFLAKPFTRNELADKVREALKAGHRPNSAEPQRPNGHSSPP